MRSYLGLDCGGSTSRARVVDETGAILYEGRSGPANWASTPREDLPAHLREALNGCPPVTSVAVCAAGVLTARDANEYSALVSSLVRSQLVRTYPDYAATFAACEDPDALSVISGTGSLIVSRDVETGEFQKSGGGGPLIGDWGSGYFVGRTAMIRLLMPRPPMARYGALCEALLETFGTRDTGEVMSEIYRGVPPAPRLAKLGSRVAAHATAGDEVCEGILAEAMEPLASLVVDHMRAHGYPQRKFTVYRAGGFWDASPLVVKFFEAHLRLPTKVAQRSPLEGAVLLAQQ